MENFKGDDDEASQPEYHCYHISDQNTNAATNPYDQAYTTEELQNIISEHAILFSTFFESQRFDMVIEEIENISHIILSQKTPSPYIASFFSNKIPKKLMDLITVDSTDIIIPALKFICILTCGDDSYIIEFFENNIFERTVDLLNHFKLCFSIPKDTINRIRHLICVIIANISQCKHLLSEIPPEVATMMFLLKDRSIRNSIQNDYSYHIFRFFYNYSQINRVDINYEQISLLLLFGTYQTNIEIFTYEIGILWNLSNQKALEKIGYKTKDYLRIFSEYSKIHTAYLCGFVGSLVGNYPIFYKELPFSYSDILERFDLSKPEDCKNIIYMLTKLIRLSGNTAYLVASRIAQTLVENYGIFQFNQLDWIIDYYTAVLSVMTPESFGEIDVPEMIDQIIAYIESCQDIEENIVFKNILLMTPKYSDIRTELKYSVDEEKFNELVNAIFEATETISESTHTRIFTSHFQRSDEH